MTRSSLACAVVLSGALPFLAQAAPPPQDLTAREFEVTPIDGRLQSRPVFASFERLFGGGNLDSYEKLILDGSRGVRAYASGEAAGNDGMLHSLELRRALGLGPARALALLFVDSGAVRLRRTLWDGPIGNIGHTNEHGLTAVGVGVNFGLAAWSVRSAMARAIGGNAGRAPDGTGSEGSKARNHIWMQASVPF